MTLQELYGKIGGDYEQALKTLRIDKLIDKHIRKLPANPIFNELIAVDFLSDGAKTFETAHAVKGVCANLGLVKMATLASDVCDEFRPGLSRKFSDAEIKVKLEEFGNLFEIACKYINEYAGA